jgi:hypothetical protein
MSRAPLFLVATLAIAPATLMAQSLERSVAAAGDGTVQFHFTARAGVCGNGRDFLRASEDAYYSNGMGGDDNCVHGPVRVVLVRDGHQVVRIETYAGPLGNDPDGGRDLGAVSTREASAYLLGLAGSLDGRPARDAFLPALLADSTVVTPQLLKLAQDRDRSRDTRASAISWAARRRNEAGGEGGATVQRALEAIVRDRSESESLRQQTLGTLSGFDRAEGIPLLISLAGDSDPWLARQALSRVANSGDPRARAYTRTALHQADLPDDSRTLLIRGVGNDYATAADFKLLRDLYPDVRSDGERTAIIGAVANAGGSDNIDWLLALAKSPTETAGRRRQAVTALARNDDPRVKDALRGLIDR